MMVFTVASLLNLSGSWLIVLGDYARIRRRILIDVRQF